MTATEKVLGPSAPFEVKLMLRAPDHRDWSCEISACAAGGRRRSRWAHRRRVAARRPDSDQRERDERDLGRSAASLTRPNLGDDLLPDRESRYTDGSILLANLGAREQSEAHRTILAGNLQRHSIGTQCLNHRSEPLGRARTAVTSSDRSGTCRNDRRQPEREQGDHEQSPHVFLPSWHNVVRPDIDVGVQALDPSNQDSTGPGLSQTVTWAGCTAPRTASSRLASTVSRSTASRNRLANEPTIASAS